VGQIFTPIFALSLESCAACPMLQGARLDRPRGPSRATVGRAVVLGIFALAGCSDEPPVELEVFSWWSQQSEAEAFARVKAIHEEEHPGVIVHNRADPDAVDQRDLMAQLLLAGAPPSTFTANIGADVLRWAVVDTADDELPSRSWIHGVTNLLQRTGLLRALPDELEEELRVGDSPELYAVPINIHRLNVLYYNVAEIERLSAERPGVDLLSLDTLCPPTGAPDLPDDMKIAIGTEDGFALILLAFENVLPALAGPAFYEALFEGRAPESVSSPGEGYEVEVRRALGCVQRLAPYFANRSSRPHWYEALDLVREGAAAFTVMGDWANGELRAELVAGTVRAIPFPGTEGTFVFTSDTFPLPIGVDHEAEVVDFLETIASQPAQRAFSSVKGSIPAWEGLGGLGALDPLAEATRADFTHPDTVRVVATSGRFPPNYQQDTLGIALRAVTAVNADETDIEAALAEFDSQAPLLAAWQARLERGVGASTQ